MAGQQLAGDRECMINPTEQEIHISRLPETQLITKFILPGVCRNQYRGAAIITEAIPLIWEE